MTLVRRYELGDGHDGHAETVIECEPSEVERELEDWIRGGDYGELATTTWIDAWYRSVDEDGDHDGEDDGHVIVAIDPDEPSCLGEEHDWQSPHRLVGGIRDNPGVWGHGAGVIISEACVRCGCGKTTDTWAQDPSNGRQGLTSVSYEPDAWADEVIPPAVRAAMAEVELGCDEQREAAAHVLLAARGEAVSVDERQMSALRESSRERLDEVIDYLKRVERAVYWSRGDVRRALRLAVRLAATDDTESRIAAAVTSAMESA